MGNTVKFLIFCLGICCLFTQPALAKNTVATHVKVIHASTGSNHIDPGLEEIVAQLRSVFTYTSYRLLSEKKLTLNFKQEGRVTLPGNRILVLTPVDLNKKKINYQIVILKNEKPIFKTQVLLQNNKSITIGGPKFEKGVLIFNISGSAK